MFPALSSPHPEELLPGGRHPRHLLTGHLLGRSLMTDSLRNLYIIFVTPQFTIDVQLISVTPLSLSVTPLALGLRVSASCCTVSGSLACPALSPSSQNVVIRPFPFTSSSPLSSNWNVWKLSRSFAVVPLMCIFRASPLDSILERKVGEYFQGCTVYVYCVPGGCVDCVPEEAVPGHLDPHHPGHAGPRVQTNPHRQLLLSSVADLKLANLLEDFQRHPCYFPGVSVLIWLWKTFKRKMKGKKYGCRCAPGFESDSQILPKGLAVDESFRTGVPETTM